MRRPDRRTGAPDEALPPGRTPPLRSGEADRLFREGIALFNGVRYWHAHEAWETMWRAATTRIATSTRA